MVVVVVDGSAVVVVEAVVDGRAVVVVVVVVVVVGTAPLDERNLEALQAKYKPRLDIGLNTIKDACIPGSHVGLPDQTPRLQLYRPVGV